MKTKLHYVFTVLFLLIGLSAYSQKDYWQKVSISEFNKTIKFNDLDKEHYQVYKLNVHVFKQQLDNAPLRGNFSGRSNTIISFPNEKGQFEKFRVVEAPVLSAELSLLHPEIKTYIGFGIDSPGARARFSVTPMGLKTMVSYIDKETVFSNPITSETKNINFFYSRKANLGAEKTFECLTDTDKISSSKYNTSSKDANDQILRTFRIAISTTAQYTNSVEGGGSAATALAAVVATLNRTNELFETDMAVTFTLVSGTEIIYEDPVTDPYIGNLNGELQATLTTVIGEANYDIGHLFVFANNNGNAGCIGCVCVDGSKGAGWSSHVFTDNDGGPYMSDFFDIDYVPHEIGHQMGANHTWSHAANEGTGVQVEPGTGTTIMGYAGIGGSSNVQIHSDPYFHHNSIDQILNNLDTRTCWTSTTITNNPPIADAGADFTIPQGTAFVLQGGATDADTSDTFTYTWEQIDSGPTTSESFGPTNTSGPMFRSRPPNVSPNRYMPKLSRVVAGLLTETNPTESADNSTWETVSTLGRDFNFALTVRDRSITGGVGQMSQSSFDTVNITVDGTSGPFVMTSQSTNETWDVGSNQTITWDVAGTDGGTINTANVDVFLSIDGGLTFPISVATDIPNTGTASITVPITGVDTTMARLMIMSSSNIFFAVNTSDFSITESEFVMALDAVSVDVCRPNDVVYTFTYNTFLGFTGTTDFTSENLPTGATAVFNPTSASADGTNVILTISGIETLSVGNYPFIIKGTSGTIESTVNLTFNIFDTTSFNTLNLTTPTDAATGVIGVDALFTWDADINAQSYDIDIATDANFTTIVANENVNTTTYTNTSLLSVTQYWWRVRAINDCGIGAYSSASFTTANVVCDIYTANDTPLPIPDNFLNGINSVINVNTPLTITDINVTVNLNHTFNNDLTITLISPSGTSVELSSNNGGDNDNYVNTVFDDDVVDLILSGTAPFTGTFQPEESLSSFNGEVSGGNWILNVRDGESDDIGDIISWNIEICGVTLVDTDDDGIPDNNDNCPNIANTDQLDSDGDGIGDVCDDDDDNDTILDDDDNCPTVPNTDQADENGNGIGDLCDIECTNFMYLGNPIVLPENGTPTTIVEIEVTDDLDIRDINVTLDIEHSFLSDIVITLESPTGVIVTLINGVCDGNVDILATFDDDGSIPICATNPALSGTIQPEGSLATFNGAMNSSSPQSSMGTWILTILDEFDGDGGFLNGATIEVCGIGALAPDGDNDGVNDIQDNCIDIPNADQADNDDDGIGDTCDNDDDDDGVIDTLDNCPFTYNPSQLDSDGDGIGDLCQFSCTTVASTTAATGFGDNPNQAIATIDITSNVAINDLNVSVDISHTWFDDLNIELTSPNGTTIVLLSSVCLNGNDILATFDDQGTDLVCGGTPVVSGTIIPQDGLSVFNGETSLGTWTLTITDNATGDQGTYNAFSIEICGANSDVDGDGVANSEDNCPETPNTDQADTDGDGVGDVCNALGVDNFTVNNISIYPNPVKTVLTIDLGTLQTDYNYAIVNVLGQQISSGSLTLNKRNINVESLQAGIYFLTINDKLASNTKILKFIKK